MGDRPRPAGAPGARNSRAAGRAGLRGRHAPGAIGLRVRHQGPFDGTGVAGRHRRRRHDPRSHFRSPQGAGPGSRPAEDRFRSRLSLARELDPSAARGGRNGLFIPAPHIRITAAEQFSSTHHAPDRPGRSLRVCARPRLRLSGGDLDGPRWHREDLARHQSRPLPPPRL
jgi:hypothetical protein